MYEAGGNHRDIDLVPEFRIRIQNYAALEVVGISGILVHQLVYFLELLHLEALFIVTDSDVYQHVLGGLEVEIIEQR